MDQEVWTSLLLEGCADYLLDLNPQWKKVISNNSTCISIKIMNIF